MYTYEESNPKTFEEVLDKYSQEDIFKIVFGDYPNYDINYHSPFRTDEHPNCFFEWYKGKLMFKDYADRVRDCFQAVKDHVGLETYSEVFNFIHDHFKDNKPIVKFQPKKVRVDNAEREFHSITVYK